MIFMTMKVVTAVFVAKYYTVLTALIKPASPSFFPISFKDTSYLH
jgi:hypothetical protein